MIIRTYLYRPNIGSFFVTKTVTPWSSTITIITGCLVKNYAPKRLKFDNLLERWIVAPIVESLSEVPYGKEDYWNKKIKLNSIQHQMMMEYPMKVSTQRKVSFPQRKEEWEGVEIKRRKQETKIS
jgi:hypothetical protein